VLVQHVDVVDAEALQAGVDHVADVLGAAVVPEPSGEPELGGEDDLVAEACDGPADDPLVLPPAVDLSSVEERDAEVVRAAYRRDALRDVAGAVGHGDPHAAVADGGDGRALLSERALLHFDPPGEMQVGPRCR
jgi:hypothetical protein